MDITTVATNVARDWPQLGKLPKPLDEAISLYEAAGYAVPPFTGVDTSKITLLNVDQVVLDLANANAAAQHFSDAKASIRWALGVQVAHAAGAAVPDLVKQLRPGFLDAVTAFADAVENLPDDLSGDALVTAGPLAVGAFLAAQEAASGLAAYDSWLGSLNQLPAYAGFDDEQVLRLLSPSSRDQFQLLVNAQGEAGPLPALYLEAVREGVTWELNTPRDTAELRQQLEAAPSPRQQLLSR